MRIHHPTNEATLVLGPFPPPVHGFSVATQRLADFVGAGGRAVVCHDLASKARNPVLRVAGNLWLALIGCGVILRFAQIGGRRVAIGVNGGFGQFFTLMLVVAGRLSGCEISLQHHSYGYILRKSRLMQLIIAADGTKTTHVFLSESMAESFMHLYGPVCRAVVSNAYLISPRPRDEAVARGSNPFRIGHLSNLSREKGLYRFIDLCQELSLRVGNFEARLAGPVAKEDDRKAIAAAVRDIPGFSYSGPLYGDEKDAFFAGLDLFVFPTEYRFEAQPIVLYEAMAQGVPVLSVDRGCIREQAEGCLKVFADLGSFSSEAPRLVADLAAQNQSDRLETRLMARDKFEEDADNGRQTLRRLFGLADEDLAS